MAYKILKLRVDWDGVNYRNRIELGDTSMNGPVDIRFVGYAGYLENVHSVFFNVTGSGSYVSDGLITTDGAGTMLFFDQSNTIGRTLTQLYEHGATLWNLTTSETWDDLTAYVLTDYVEPSISNGFSYECSVAGTSSGTEPTWPTTLESTVVDGSVTWTCKSIRAKLNDANDIDLQGKTLLTSDGSDLKFSVRTGKSFVFEKT